jgi:hypothetical protein
MGTGARRRRKMQLTGGIKVTKRHWLGLDLLAILLVAGTLTGIIAISTGAWWPIGWLLMPEWPLLAFFAWFVAITTALALFGAHLQWSNTVHAASAREDPATAAKPLTEAQPAPIRFGRSALGLGQNEGVVEDELTESEGVEAEPSLTAAGR